MKIIAIKTNEGYLISDNIENKNYTNSFLGSFLFDGFLPEKTFKLDWLDIPKDRPEYIILRNDNFQYDIIPTSEDENDIILNTYMLKVCKNTIQCMCYAKYDGSIEICSEEININEL